MPILVKLQEIVDDGDGDGGENKSLKSAIYRLSFRFVFRVLSWWLLRWCVVQYSTILCRSYRYYCMVCRVCGDVGRCFYSLHASRGGTGNPHTTWVITGHLRSEIYALRKAGNTYSTVVPVLYVSNGSCSLIHL